MANVVQASVLERSYMIYLAGGGVDPSESSTAYVLTRIVRNRVVSRALMISARRIMRQARALCAAAHEWRRTSDLSNHLAKYAKTSTHMRRYLPIAGAGGDLLHVEAEERPEAIVVRLSGEVDLANVNRLREAIQPALTSCRNLVLDVSALRYIDSTGLHVLLDASQELQRHGRRLAVAGASPVIAKVIRILHIDQLLPLVTSVEQALQLVRGRPASTASDG